MEEEKNTKKKMKRSKKIILIILGVFVVLSVALTIWQWNNIKAVYYAFKFGSSESITREIEKQKKEREEIVSEYVGGTVRDFTTEEEEKIVSGEMTVEEATELIKKEFEDSKNKGQSASGSAVERPQSDTKKNEQKSEIDEFIADNIIQLYSYKAYYLGQLGQIEKAAKADYVALPKADRTMVSRQAIVDKYIGRANSLLVECDAKVAKIMNSLSERLKKNNMDTSLVDKIGKSYEEEKALKKAYYLSLLNG